MQLVTELPETLQSFEFKFAADARSLDELPFAVTEGAGGGESVGEGIGVAQGGDGGAQFRVTVGVELKEGEKGVAIAHQIVFQQRVDAAELACAAIAVVAESQFALPALRR